jgi:hypothetical protein
VVRDDTVTFVPYALADWDDYADRVTVRVSLPAEIPGR